MKSTFIRPIALVATVLALSAGAANARNVSFGYGFYAPAPVYYDPYYYPQPVYFAPSYRHVYYQPLGRGWHRGWHKYNHHAHPRDWEHGNRVSYRTDRDHDRSDNRPYRRSADSGD